MKENKDCKIVQDLLPNYIEKLTSEETNKHIEEHLKECEECKKTLGNMQNNLELNSQKRDRREIKYIKKYSNKMKLLKVVLLLIVAIFIITTGRKMIIISNLQNKASEYVSFTNFHKITYSYQQDTYIKAETFCLGDKKAVIMTKIIDGDKTVTKIYTNGNDVNIYTETEDKKVVKLNQKMQVEVNVSNSLYTENWWHLLIASIPTSISTKEMNGKECYYIANYASPYMFCEDGTYIDKETGLVVRTISTTETMSNDKYLRPAVDYVYEFNTVTEKDFIEPDISKYEIEE